MEYRDEDMYDSAMAAYSLGEHPYAIKTQMAGREMKAWMVKQIEFETESFFSTLGAAQVALEDMGYHHVGGERYEADGNIFGITYHANLVEIDIR